MLERFPMIFLTGVGSFRIRVGTAMIWWSFASCGFFRRSMTSIVYWHSRCSSQIFLRFSKAVREFGVCPATYSRRIHASSCRLFVLRLLFPIGLWCSWQTIHRTLSARSGSPVDLSLGRDLLFGLFCRFLAGDILPDEDLHLLLFAGDTALSSTAISFSISFRLLSSSRFFRSISSFLRSRSAISLLSCAIRAEPKRTPSLPLYTSRSWMPLSDRTNSRSWFEWAIPRDLMMENARFRSPFPSTFLRMSHASIREETCISVGSSA